MSFESRGSTRPQGAAKVQQKQSDYSSNSLHDAVRAACHEVNMGPIPELPEIGEVRCPGINKKPPNTAGWIKIKSDCAHIKDHSSSFTLTVFADKPRSHAGVVESKRKRARAESMRQAKQCAAHEAAALMAASTWAEASDAPVSGYMASKGLTYTHGARLHPRLKCWLIPLIDVHGKLYNLQRIYNDGKKLFMKSGRITGCFALLGQLDTKTRQIVIVEGFSTGGSIREEFGEVVACALNAGNLKPVCEVLRETHPDVKMIVCGDDDKVAPVNVGRQKAIAAASSVNGEVSFPTFCENCNRGCTDFNDAIQCQNSEASR